jgi:DNA-binding NarL/FixJ family response regulator
MKKVIIIEDNMIIAELIQKQINNQGEYFCNKYYLNPVEFLKSEDACDIILLDIMMPEMTGLDAIDKILGKLPNVSIIINSIKDDSETIFKALQKGAVGYIDKQSFDNSFIDVFKTVENGGAYMTPKIARKVMDFFSGKNKLMGSLSEREVEVANAILDGLSYKMIADKFLISLDTVRSHIKNIYKKLSINSKSELFNIFKKK